MQIFPPSANTIARAGLVGGLAAVAGLFVLAGIVQRSDYATQAGMAREQPIPFSHAHHAGGLGLDCRYCHVSVETAAFAGIPSVKACMTCHSQVHADAPVLEPLRESWRTGRPLAWTRLNDLPDFVYFDHSIHVHKGVGCATCHGRIDEMPLTRRERPWHMHECLDCHRHPERSLQPRETVFDLRWTAPSGRAELGRRLAREYDVQRRIDCATCHR